MSGSGRGEERENLKKGQGWKEGGEWGGGGHNVSRMKSYQ
jgi:hypothetical protein